MAAEKTQKKEKKSHKKRADFIFGGLFVCVVLFLIAYLFFCTNFLSGDYKFLGSDTSLSATSTTLKASPPQLDKVAYDVKLVQLANYPVATTSKSAATSTASSTPLVVHPWPVKTVYPNYGALLPFNRIVAYYGNFYSTSMGVLGQYPPDQMIEKLSAAAADWQAADPTTPVIPAIDYIAVTAQGSAGTDGKYRLRMPDSQIDKALELADRVGGIVVLDIQVGLSDVQTELSLLEKYLKLPQVHLALDPEFAMKNGARPGTVIGTMDASDINFAATYLARLVRENDLPPKILIVHRFTTKMVTNSRQISPLPEVQIVMDMDGWSIPAKKVKTYLDVIYDEPVQFTGFKLFYKNDLAEPTKRLLTPSELLRLKPQPSFIQYQ